MTEDDLLLLIQAINTKLAAIEQRVSELEYKIGPLEDHTRNNIVHKW